MLPLSHLFEVPPLCVFSSTSAPLQVEEPRTESTRNWVYGQDLSLECAFSGSDIQQILWHTTSTSVNVSMYHASETERGGDYGLVYYDVTT